MLVRSHRRSKIANAGQKSSCSMVVVLPFWVASSGIHSRARNDFQNRTAKIHCFTMSKKQSRKCLKKFWKRSPNLRSTVKCSVWNKVNTHLSNSSRERFTVYRNESVLTYKWPMLSNDEANFGKLKLLSPASEPWNFKNFHKFQAFVRIIETKIWPAGPFPTDERSVNLAPFRLFLRSLLYHLQQPA